MIKVYEYVNLHKTSRFLCGFIAPTSKTQIAVTISPNCVMIIILWKYWWISIEQYLDHFLGGMLGCKHSHHSICIFGLKYYQISIKFYEHMNLYQISRFLYDFITEISKIQIAVSIRPNFIMRIFCESTDKSLSNDMLIICFGCVVEKISPFNFVFLIWDIFKIG